MRFALIFCFLLTSNAQSPDEYRVYTEHPRLFLNAQRLRLLKRERSRESMRWRQFELLVRAAAQLPEPGFALALYFEVTGDEAIGKRAVDWALGPGADLRQLALVYDWCQPLLTPAQSKTLAAKIQRLADQKSLPTIEGQRDRVLAVLAIAGDLKHPEESYLRETVEQWWRGQLAPALKDGRVTVPLHELFALLEILHAVRDNASWTCATRRPSISKSFRNTRCSAIIPRRWPRRRTNIAFPYSKGTGSPIWIAPRWPAWPGSAWWRMTITRSKISTCKGG